MTRSLLCAVLLLLGCTRSVRTQQQTREVGTLEQSASSTAAVDTHEMRGPVVTVVEEWGVEREGLEPSVPVTAADLQSAAAPGPHPLRGEVARAGFEPAMEGYEPSDLDRASRPRVTDRRILLRRTTITQGPVVLDTHAVSATSTQAHAAREVDTTVKAETETSVGLSWAVKLAIFAGIIVLVLLAWRFRSVLF